MEPSAPSHNDARNDRGPRACPVCQHPFQPRGRQQVCSAACRQALWRLRHPPLPPSVPDRSSRSDTIYECPSCDARYLGEQRCADCGVFCRRVGPGGPCPHCGEPVAVADLVATQERR